MPKDIIPTAVLALLAFAQNFKTRLTPHIEQLGLDPGVDDEIEMAHLSLGSGVAEADGAKAAYHSKVTEKYMRAETLEAILRRVIREVKASPNCTETILEDLGLKAEESAGSDDPVFLETPNLTAEVQSEKVVIRFRVSQNLSSRACKPSWAKACLIYRKKSSEQTYQFIGFATRSPFVDIITGPAANYTYIARYQGSTPTELGPMSPPLPVAAQGDYQLAA